MKKRYTEDQIIGFPKQADAGVAVKELCRKHGFQCPLVLGLLQQLLGIQMLARPWRLISGIFDPHSR